MSPRRPSRRWIAVASVAVVAWAPAFAGCPGTRDGLDRAQLPQDVQADYDVFAQRCSKCHTLARPLDSGIKDDGWWSRYVARMRRMPSSGISEQDAAPILRFLHWYSTSPASPGATILNLGPPPEPSSAPLSGSSATPSRGAP
ncbi:MAG: hypothetical protein ACHREM_33610 [Polyangiales bacterium]